MFRECLSHQTTEDPITMFEFRENKSKCSDFLKTYKTSSIDYNLPEDLIAEYPLETRHNSRLLVLNPKTQKIRHSVTLNLDEFLPPGSLLVANDSRVIPARLKTKKDTGGALEIFFVRILRDYKNNSCCIMALAKSSRALKTGDIFHIANIKFKVKNKLSNGELEVDVFASPSKLLNIFNKKGEIPLPPYIKRNPEKLDELRYQTIYADKEGSVAAPTAGLHFSSELITKLKGKGFVMEFLTLHVGPGTFRPVKTDSLDEHKMDEEEYFLGAETIKRIENAKESGRKIVAVGTTTVRALEGNAAAYGDLKAGTFFTDIFIKPGFKFKIIDGLLTNFHLPKSTLLSLVFALAGRQSTLKAYKNAIKNKYRFYSYGDAMLILPG